MATAPKAWRTREIEYPSGDGKPVAETALHVRELLGAIQLLDIHFADQPDVFVGGNNFLYYVKGNRRKHVSPDVMVTIGIPKLPLRDYYLVWEEGKAPDFIVEISSKSTKREDMKVKFELYRDVLRVREYFLFDPRAEYLNPPLQGFRLAGADYVPIEPVAGRLPSEVLGLHLERVGDHLRFFNPVTGAHLLNPIEAREAADRRAEEARRRAEEERRLAEEARRLAEEARRLTEEARRRAEEERDRAEEERRRAEAAEAGQRNLAAENERLRREIEAMRRG
jgi:Uma2 family endonuclease